MKKVSDAISVIFILIAVIFFVIAGSFPEGTNGALGPGWFPRIMCVIIVVLSVVNLVTTHIEVKKKSQDTSGTPEEAPAEVKLFGKNNLRVWISAGATLLYVICIQAIGFCVGSVIYMLAMNLYYKVPEKSKVAAFVLPFAVTGILYFVFWNLLHVVLPSGILF